MIVGTVPFSDIFSIYLESSSAYFYLRVKILVALLCRGLINIFFEVY